jgi:hypothetical protein
MWGYTLIWTCVIFEVFRVWSFDLWRRDQFFPRNVCICLQDFTVLQPWRPFWNLNGPEAINIMEVSCEFCNEISYVLKEFVDQVMGCQKFCVARDLPCRRFSFSSSFPSEPTACFSLLPLFWKNLVTSGYLAVYWSSSLRIKIWAPEPVFTKLHM